MRKLLLLLKIVAASVLIAACGSGNIESTSVSQESQISQVPISELTPTTDWTNEAFFGITFDVPVDWRKEERGYNIFFYPTSRNLDGMLQVFIANDLRASNRHEFIHLIDSFIGGLNDTEQFVETNYLDNNTMIAGHYAARHDYTMLISNTEVGFYSYIIVTNNVLFSIAIAITDYSPANMQYVFSRAVSSIEIEAEDVPEIYIPTQIETVDIPEIDTSTQMLNDRDMLLQILTHISILDFGSVVDMVDYYLESVNADDEDVAHEIRELAIRANEIMEDMLIIVDDFDGQITVYSPGVREITQTISIVPYLRPAIRRNPNNPSLSATVFLRMGFHRSAWLHFDRTSLRLSNGTFYERTHGFFDRTTNIFLGGISEEVVIDSSLIHWNSHTHNRLVSYMDVDYAHVLRFTNRSDDVHHDVTLSNAEIIAVRNIFELYQLMGRLGHEIPSRFR